MFCKKCGNQVNDGATFCNKCGSAMSQASASASSQPATMGAAGTATMTKPAARSTTKRVVIILIVFVVVIGAVVFGLGKKQQSDNEVAIRATLQDYCTAMSSLDFKKADSFCEEGSKNLVTPLLEDIPYGNLIASGIKTLGSASGVVTFSITPSGEIEIEKNVAVIPIAFKLAVAEAYIEDIPTYNTQGKVTLAKSSEKWLIRSITLSA